jgi:hypothetical protein
MHDGTTSNKELFAYIFKEVNRIDNIATVSLYNTVYIFLICVYSWACLHGRQHQLPLNIFYDSKWDGVHITPQVILKGKPSD